MRHHHHTTTTCNYIRVWIVPARRVREESPARTRIASRESVSLWRVGAKDVEDAEYIEMEKKLVVD